mmetsp:Transcript_74594/g.180311  ORF Transcript_74594/g.180311 Transcript_74594/m.180311 type:complete len:276 (-) Transcript_74594:591-1418(-)
MRCALRSRIIRIEICAGVLLILLRLRHASGRDGDVCRDGVAGTCDRRLGRRNRIPHSRLLKGRVVLSSRGLRELLPRRPVDRLGRLARLGPRRTSSRRRASLSVGLLGRSCSLSASLSCIVSRSLGHSCRVDSSLRRRRSLSLSLSRSLIHRLGFRNRLPHSRLIKGRVVFSGRCLGELRTGRPADRLGRRDRQLSRAHVRAARRSDAIVELAAVIAIKWVFALACVDMPCDARHAEGVALRVVHVFVAALCDDARHCISALFVEVVVHFWRAAV